MSLGQTLVIFKRPVPGQHKRCLWCRPVSLNMLSVSIKAHKTYSQSALKDTLSYCCAVLKCMGICRQMKGSGITCSLTSKEQAQQPCIRSLQLWHHQDFEELCQMISQGTSENLQCWCCPEFYRLAQIMSVKEWIRGLNTGVWCKATHLSSASPPEYLPQVLFSICQHSANVLDNPGH